MRRLAVMALCALVLPASARAWTWPVDGPVLRPFSFDRAHPYAAGQHRGLDLGAPTGASVVSPVAGVVTFAGTVPTGGKTVSIETPSGYTATLVHLGSIGVKQGTRIPEGATLGTVGPSGVPDLAQPYVYFGLRETAVDEGYVDPLGFLPARPLAGTPAPQPQPERAADPAATSPVAQPAAATAPAAVVASPQEATTEAAVAAEPAPEIVAVRPAE